MSKSMNIDADMLYTICCNYLIGDVSQEFRFSSLRDGTPTLVHILDSWMAQKVHTFLQVP